MKKRFQRRKMSNDVDVDITSLLDILTILLVFLLQSYNSSDLRLDLVKNIDLADSKVREITKFAPVLQVTKESEVFLNNKSIGRLPASGSMDELTVALKNQRDLTAKDNATKTAKQKHNEELINLVFDKDMDYEVVQRVMNDSAHAGYSQFKFIVKGNY
ncbi:MAG TPA: biopolymer transporter ExbD [Bacteriovoracaceae bacterium]|nr:biopolymer transporter ExbD [Bacteriovoracaceae bacterium]